MSNTVAPRLIVVGADRAIDFYQQVFGAKLVERYADGDGHVVHAALDFGQSVISIAEAREAWNNVAPTMLGGTPVILDLIVDDADAVGARLTEAGAETVFPIADQFYGHREGRFRDPFGHLWIITGIIEDLSAEEIERRMAGA